MLNWLWTSFVALPWWAMILWCAYTIYFIIRAWNIWDETTDYGVAKGYKNVIFGYEKHIRLYHVVRIVFDIPPAIIGLLFPLLRKMFSLKLYTFKEEKKGSETK